MLGDQSEPDTGVARGGFDDGAARPAAAPLASAASIIFTAIRSLELPPGLRYSTFAATSAGTGGDDGVQANQRRAADEVTDVLRNPHAFIVSGDFGRRTPATAPRSGTGARYPVASRMYSPIWRSERIASGTIGAASWKSWIWPGQTRTSAGTPDRGQPACRQLRVVQQHLGSGHVDQRPRQARFDVLQRLVNLFRFAVDDVLGGGASNQLDERIEGLRAGTSRRS